MNALWNQKIYLVDITLEYIYIYIYIQRQLITCIITEMLLLEYILKTFQSTVPVTCNNNVMATILHMLLSKIY